MEKTTLKVGPLVVIWLTKHVDKFMKENNIGFDVVKLYERHTSYVGVRRN